jgi:hypothetical protein
MDAARRRLWTRQGWGQESLPTLTGMLLLFDGDVVVAAAVTVAADAAACRALAAEMSGLGEVADLAETDIRAGVGELVDVCADVLDVVAIDLDLVAARMSAGARLYSAVEAAAAAAIPSQRR